MSESQDPFLQQLRAAFRVEADEHLRTIADGLLELEGDPSAERQTELLSAIFRDAHSLKGAARAVNADEVEQICQSMESVFAAWRQHIAARTQAGLDTLHHAVSVAAAALAADGQVDTTLSDEIARVLDALAEVVRASSGDSPPRAEAPPAALAPGSVAPASQAGEQAATSAVPAALLPAMPATSGHAMPETLRISTAKLDNLLLQAEELLTIKLGAVRRSTEFKELRSMVEGWDREWAKVSDDADALRRLSSTQPADELSGSNQFSMPLRGQMTSGVAIERLVAFADWSVAFNHRLRERLRALAKVADQERRETGSKVDALLEDTKKLLMLPVSTLFGVFPKLVRDLAHEQEKSVKLVLRGGDVEIDKRILEEMKDPLIHLLRNAVDHGVETAPQRARAGKPRESVITVSAAQVDGNKVEITVSDDGGGIDPAAVKDSAIRHGSLTPDKARDLDDRKCLDLIFLPEISTSALITEISGRGLGLAIVKEKVEKLGGTVVLDTRLNVGTTFRLVLPLTLATFRGILIQVEGHTVVVPTARVDRALRLRRTEVKTVENRETVLLAGQAVALVRLEDVLEFPRMRKANEAPPESFLTIIVLGAGEGRIAFEVDAVVGEQEVLVKPLGPPLSRVRNVAGAMLLGDGRSVAVLNTFDLLKSAAKLGRPAAAAPSTATTRASILVVEDSITARMLLKNILESAGYTVKTATDGVDGFTALQLQPFDLVVSDVEMPRMNGFELTAKIRGDQRFADLPVVLVTALASREHRERGVDVGANAYIVKGNFEQRNLLDIIRTLL